MKAGKPKVVGMSSLEAWEEDVPASYLEPADALELEAVQLEKEAEQKVDEADQKVGDERLVAVWPGLESICAGATRAKGHADEEEVGMGMD